MTSLGEQLRLARRAKSKSLEDISRDTNISKRYLQALEEDDYDILPGSAYVKGFLSNYAKCVGLDPKAVVEQYNKLAGLTELLESGASSNGAVKSKTRRVIRRRVFMLLVAIALLLLCLVLILQLRGS
jgi:cytoskeletal protein RodZ